MPREPGWLYALPQLHSTPSLRPGSGTSAFGTTCSRIPAAMHQRKPTMKTAGLKGIVQAVEPPAPPAPPAEAVVA